MSFDREKRCPLCWQRVWDDDDDFQFSADDGAPRRIPMDEIVHVVCSHFKINRGDILSNRRTANTILPRHLAIYLSRILTANSLSVIGHYFGRRDHTTVHYAIRKIERLLGDGVGDVADDVAALKQIITRQIPFAAAPSDRVA